MWMLRIASDAHSYAVGIGSFPGLIRASVARLRRKPGRRRIEVDRAHLPVGGLHYGIAAVDVQRRDVCPLIGLREVEVRAAEKLPRWCLRGTLI
ncbi:MAG TPA: hypothetical protein VKI44_37155 [Acetobacteraceae bacterium]|nr:hypothetical protein [Acetobacteraceae bacterium]